MSDNVITALAAVMAELPAIGKDQNASSQQGGYPYRGIEQITGLLQPLLAKHGVVFVPRVESWEVRDLVVNGKPWTDTVLSVAYDVFGPAGVEDRIQIGPILAIGRDNSDKGANKCMTQAFKYALLQTFCISDKKDDTDGQSHEADARPDPVPGFRSSLMAARDALTDDERALLREWIAEQGLPASPAQMNQEQAEQVCEFIVRGLPKVDA